MAGGSTLNAITDNGATPVQGMGLKSGTDTTAPALTTQQMQDMANQRQADSQRASYLLSSTPVQQYYNPAAQQPTLTQSPTLRVPGYQGVRNPFVSQAVATQPLARTQQSAAQLSNLLNQTNQYRQGYADQLYQSQQANLAQLMAAQKAYQDNMAARKAEAEAAAARAQAEAAAASYNGNTWDPSYNGVGGANGGIADLTQGFK